MKTFSRFTTTAITVIMLVACATPSAPPSATFELTRAATRTVESSPTNAPVEIQTGPRRPRGIYAEVHIDLIVDQQQKIYLSITPAGLHTFMKNLYDNLLVNPADSGLAVGVNWSRLNPSSKEYDWSWLDDAFTSVAAWNAANSGKAPKTIQVQVSAGFGTPQWLMDQIPSCDGLFIRPPQKPPGNCGKATFLGFVEGGGGVLPMPWNTLYKNTFRSFLMAFAGRYGANPSLVSIDVSGPTAASTEMIFPNSRNTPNQTQFEGMRPDEMWLKLLAFAYPDKPAYQQSDQAFIDEWEAAVDMFGGIFSGVTLVATTGNGFPDFSNTGFTVPTAFKDDCPTPNMDCAAETTILTHFVDPSVGDANAKATQGSGMRGSGVGVGNFGAAAPRRLSQRTVRLKSPAAQILGGMQFDTSVALDSVMEGCTTRFPPAGKEGLAQRTDLTAIPVAELPPACLAPGITQADLAGYKQFGDVPARDVISPEQALYNVLRVFFEGTPAADSFGGTRGTAPENYLQVYNQDFKYATAHASEPARIVRTDGTSVMMTAQDLLNLASQKLYEIAKP